MKENNWNLNIKTYFAKWMIIGSGENKDEVITELNQLMKEILETGFLHRIFYTQSFNEGIISNLVDEIILSDPLHAPNICGLTEALPFNSLIHVYDQNKLSTIEFNCQNLSSILEYLKHPLAKNQNWNNFSFINIGKSYHPRINSFYLEFTINSDIFFPYVMCPWKWIKKYDGNDDIGPSRNEIDYKIHGYNNTELATLNGERLNLFLKGVKDYIDTKENLSWIPPEPDYWVGYQKYVKETHIELEV